MNTKTRRKQMDHYQCQICGDYHAKKYPSKVTVQVQTHHIIPLSEGGKTELNNLITLCDLCHAVVTPQRWKEYFGEAGNIQNMEPIKVEFNEYLTSDSEKREKIKKRIWNQFQIEPRNKNH
jgi:hypothetical protein